MPLSLSQADANARAYALACKRAREHLICFANDSLPVACVGTEYVAVMQIVGGVEPISYAVTLGALPAGLQLDGQSGVISGLVSQPFSTSLRITATDGSGASMTKEFAFRGIGMTSPTGLPAGTVGSAYSYQMLAAGTSGGLVWSVTSGALPTGLTMSATGLISGTPTADGTASFTVSLEDAAGAFCEKEFTIEVGLAVEPVVYWPLEAWFDIGGGFSATPSTGAVAGDLDDLNSSGPITDFIGAGKIGFGVDLLLDHINFGQSVPTVDVRNGSFTLRFWLRSDGVFADGSLVAEQRDSWAILTHNTLGVQTLSFRIRLNTFVYAEVFSSVPFTSGAWHRVVVWRDIISGQIGIVIDNNAPNVLVAPTLPLRTNEFIFFGAADASILPSFDEIGYWSGVWTAADRTSDWNGGVGRTWP